MTEDDKQQIEESEVNGKWVRTRVVEGQQKWRVASDDEVALAEATGVPVHMLNQKQVDQTN